MEERDFIISAFAEYYQNAAFDIASIEQREFGIGNIKKIDARHLNFASIPDFRRYLLANTPRFVSHSISYYEFPSATPMDRKKWKAADLVFDLDIHAEGKYGAYEKLLAVKQDASRLLNDFIINDFGLHKSQILTAFSGNRGYHIHIRNEKFASLGSDERRELVDYVMGRGLDYLQFFSFGENKKLLGPSPNEGGYRGRFARAAIHTINQEPNSISRKFTDQKSRDSFIAGINDGNWSRTTLDLKELPTRFKAVAASLPISSVDTDAGVTQDLSKLIRVPNTIHGDTGFIAKITSDLDSFEPFRDALIQTDQEIEIEFMEDVPSLPFFGQSSESYKKGSIAKVNRSVGIFFVLKGSAKVKMK